MQKTILTIFTFIFLLSCSNNDKPHVEAAKKFAENMSTGKISEAKNYATESTGKLLDLAISKDGHKPDPNFNIVILKDSIDQNDAWVKFSDKNESEKSQEFHLIKVDDKWLVNLNRKQKKVFK